MAAFDRHDTLGVRVTSSAMIPEADTALGCRDEAQVGHGLMTGGDSTDLRKRAFIRLMLKSSNSHEGP